ncbi:MAG: adenylosuccinate lyase [Silvanigrellales bacterium]|nr:adenylosuccinate lyase [Silvanigrellales bacterium]
MIERYSRPEMKCIWSEDAKYASWAKVERAHLETLVEASEADAGVLASFDKAVSLKREADFLAREQETGHDVIAFIAELASAMGDSGRFLHKGLTSSDVLDTAVALRLTSSLDLITLSLAEVREALAVQAYTHASTPCIGRTHGIHAEPLSFGQVLASHFAEFQRAHLDVLAARKGVAYGKLSGAVGGYSQLPADFEARVLRRLGLAAEPVATQVIPRDRILRAVQALVSVAGAIDRFALNMRHWARTELGEVLEPFSEKQKGSSAMPHKRNPILSENLCGLARTVRGYADMVAGGVALWHERDISHSSVERVALADAFVTTHFMLSRTAGLVSKMVVRPDVMKANLGRLGGLWASQTVLTALVERGMNRQEAYELIQKVALPLAEKAALGAVEPDAFLKGLQSHTKVVALVGEQNLKGLFALDRFLACVPVVFRRTFGMVPEEYTRLTAHGSSHGSSQAARIVPALHRVYAVTVELLPDVLDTEAKTVETAMRKGGVDVLSLRQARTFLVRQEGVKTSEAAENALRKVEAYAKETLHNGVMEQFRVEVVQ